MDLTGSTVWVVDDDSDHTFLLNRILSKAGFTVRGFNDGISALSELSHELPELILLDVEMPEMDGLEVCRKIQADPATAEVPVIFLSGRRDAEGILGGLGAGAVDYITKPCRKEEVLARVNIHLTLAKTRKGLESANAELAEEVRQRKVVEKEREALIKELEGALQKIRTMAPLIPICSNCRKIRDDKGYWTRLERYLTEYTGSMVTHGICPDCVKELYPELDEPES